MVDVMTEIKIRCPLEKVSEYAANPDNAPEWYDNIHSAEWQTPKLLAVGSRIAFKAQFLRRELAYVYEVVEFIPGEKLVMSTANGPFPMETTYTWEAIDASTTLMTLRNKGNPTGFSKLMAPFMSTMMRQANKKDLKKIKEILEKRF
ncbi:polyketide cyclase/dehydrase/lipid transport protein [Bacillus oleivorans]|uniref:Polyketide cyclase/dehydrase/lipid transport protein n=1 Tax=Bacillus oleivorans TaxID=1448271 RepID=A0A285CT57_9BACI|nr:SRPBCC family protein [Bacillus oleivorans]SNX70702.1 polyketide cyclase/dehydrase/lipid transport protein [Bacillus oleivorans]